MGGFYGSVQIRGEGREAIKGVVEKLARKEGQRFLVGPELGEWVGVYPRDTAKIPRSAAISPRLPGELFYLLVHDDDVFIYEYYCNGKVVDRYNSCPDFFQEISASQRRKLSGRPETFAHLIPSEEIFALKAILANREAEPVVFASSLLERFAQALGIRNAITSYEYLQNGETDGVEGWDQFVHIPDLRQRTNRSSGLRSRTRQSSKV